MKEARKHGTLKSRESAGQPAKTQAKAAQTNAAGQPFRNAPFPIVGIGASAGGLEAFTQLLKHLPIDTGMGFVLVQHLDPEHESALTQILARATSMPVREVANNLRVAGQSRLYHSAEYRTWPSSQGVLKLQPPADRAGAASFHRFLF